MHVGFLDHLFHMSTLSSRDGYEKFRTTGESPNLILYYHCVHILSFFQEFSWNTIHEFSVNFLSIFFLFSLIFFVTSSLHGAHVTVLGNFFHISLSPKGKQLVNSQILSFTTILFIFCPSFKNFHETQHMNSWMISFPISISPCPHYFSLLPQSTCHILR